LNYISYSIDILFNIIYYLGLDLNIFEKEKFSGKYILTLEYKFNGLQKFEFIYYLNEEILNLNDRKITDEDILIICSILDNIKYTKIKKIYFGENFITEKGFVNLINFLLKFDENIQKMNNHNHQIDSDVMKIDSILLNNNKIDKFDKGFIDNLFRKCKYIKYIDLSQNPFTKDSNEKAEFYNFFNE
jgi:hypothetical protein